MNVSNVPRSWADNLSWDDICFVMSKAAERGYLRGSDVFWAWCLYWDVDMWGES